jgi:hypothetical protein
VPTLCRCGREKLRDWQPYCVRCYARLPRELRLAIDGKARTIAALDAADRWLAADRAAETAKLERLRA